MLILFTVLILTFNCLSTATDVKYYDYIVVGGGTAGCIIAGRLATTAKVLMIEAGGEPPEAFLTERNLTNILGTEYDWKYPTEKMTSLQNRTAYFGAGKMLGGTGSFNLMFYMRGNKRDYDNWKEEHGAEGWGWNDILPSFKSIENTQIESDKPDVHGRNGPIKLTSAGSDNALLKRIVETMNGMNYPKIDVNSGEQRGVDYTPVNFYNGKRESTYLKYVKIPFVDNENPNLEIVTEAVAEKIIIEQNTAVGVTFTKNGRKLTAKASREVILTAGVFGSPQLLMLSGIGPRDHLESLNIPVVKDLPVGNNFHDHFGIKQNPYFTTKDEYGSAVAFVSANQEEKFKDYPNIQFIHFLLNKVEGAATILLRPKSRGTVRLRSNDISDKPIINPNFLAEQSDLETFAAGLMMMNRILFTMDVSDTGYQKLPPPPLKCTEYQKTDIEYWKCLSLTYGTSAQHPVGTCKMGGSDRTDSVVDHELRVIGVKHLRVADASIMPSIVSTNTQAAVMMIAEKAAQMIHNDAQKNYWPIIMHK